MLDPYMNHVMRILHQQEAIQKFERSLTENDELLHVDFSKNYNCKYADEPQAVHFGASRQSLTLHTGVWYTKGSKQSFCTISDSLRHDPPAILAHLIPIFRVIFDGNDSITHVHFLSYGPTTQYRNKTTFALLTTYLVSVEDIFL